MRYKSTQPNPEQTASSLAPFAPHYGAPRHHSVPKAYFSLANGLGHSAILLRELVKSVELVTVIYAELWGS